MKANRELMVGKPKIYGTFESDKYHNFTIEFEEGATINAYSVSDENHVAILNKAKTNLNSLRGLTWVLKYLPTFALFWINFLIGWLFLLVLTDRETEFTTSLVLGSKFAFFWYLLIAVGIFRFWISKRQPVFFGEKSQLWEKVKENTLSHLGVFFLGVCLTWLAAKFGFKS